VLIEGDRTLHGLDDEFLSDPPRETKVNACVHHCLHKEKCILEFIAHLLFGLSQETITSPVLFAASRFLNREEPATDFLELAQMEPISLALELRKNRYREGWGDRQAVEQLARADAYEQLARLEAFDLDHEYWDRAAFDQVEGDELELDEYIQLSFVEGDSNLFSTADELWQVVKNQLKDEMPRASYEERLKESGGVSYENDVLTVGVSDEFTRDWLEDRLSATIQRILTGINRRQSEVLFVKLEVN